MTEYRVADLPERIGSKIEVEADTGCWLWNAYVTPQGYAQARWKGKLVRIHRLTFHLLADTSFIPLNGEPGDQLDHLCGVRRCVNPAHLERVTNRENTTRSRLGRTASRYVGVSPHRRTGLWQVKCKIDGRHRWLGHFDDEIAAARAYDDAMFAHCGDRPNARFGLFDGKDDPT